VAARPDSGPFLGPSALAVAITTVATLPIFLTGALAVQIGEDIALTAARLGTLTALFFTTSALSSSVSGHVAERFGFTLGMRFAAGLSALACFTIALRPAWSTFLVMLLAAGFANSAGQVSSNLYIAQRISSTRHGFAYGIKQSGVLAATLLGGLAVPVIALTVGWRWAFVGTAVVAAFLIPLIPSTHSAPVARSEAAAAASPLPLLILLAAGAAAGAAAANSLGAFFVASSVHDGLSEGSAGLLFALGSCVGLAARLGLGRLADARTGGRLNWVALLLLAGAAGYLLLSTSADWIVFPATVLCFGGGWGWPGLFNFAVVNRNREAPAAATGITQTGAYLGAIAGPLSFGRLAEGVSYDAAWLLAAGLALVGAASIVVARRFLLRSTS
jgi:MFS family permease